LGFSLTADRKQPLREDMLAKRRALTADAIASVSGRLATVFLQQIPFAKYKVAAGYKAIHGEVDVAMLLARLEARNMEIALPAVVKMDGPLVFRRWKPGDALVQGEYGVEVPPQEAPVVVPDLVIVPLLAFDGRGHRLGYGKGYYDRTLADLRFANPKLLAVGVAYKMQAVRSVPAEKSDEPLDAVVTEDGAFFFSDFKKRT
jgi:5-formyltetrahydrofolate cyclo-ligase